MKLNIARRRMRKGIPGKRVGHTESYFFKIVTGVWKMEMVGMIGLLSMCAEKLN